MKIYNKILSFFLLSMFIFPLSFAEEITSVEKRLNELHITLPPAASPLANYVPYKIIGKMVYISGQLPIENGKIKFTGKIGKKASLEEGKEAAKLCMLHIISQLKAAIGSLDKVKTCVKISGFINASSPFADHAQIMNGASDVLVNVFGEKGKHARVAVGVASLPLNASVEIDAIFEIE